MPNMQTELGDGEPDPEGWPERPGYSAVSGSPSLSWWCRRCGAIVKRGAAVIHDDFHERVDPR